MTIRGHTRAYTTVLVSKSWLSHTAMQNVTIAPTPYMGIAQVGISISIIFSSLLHLWQCVNNGYWLYENLGSIHIEKQSQCA